MKIQVYLNDWFYNAGIVGFLKILEHSDQNFVIKERNYIEFDTKYLKDFDTYYFKYFMDKYNIANKVKKRIENNISKIKSYLAIEELDTNKAKKLQDNIKREKKFIKDIIKTQMDKVNKFDNKTYQVILEQYNKIDKIKEKHEFDELFKIQEVVYENLSKENINNKLTLNSFKKVLGDNFFGQQSFFNITYSSKTFEEQKQIMYKDYVSNIVEVNFLNEVLNDRYQLKEITEYIKELKEEKNITKEIEKVYNNIYKMIEKGKELEKIKEYIKGKVFSNCCMCSNSHHFVSDYSEGMFIPLAVSSKNMQNYFWNQNVKFPICDVCKLMLLCTPAGINNAIKIVKEYDKGNYEYKEKEVMSFVNYDTSVDQLLKINKDFSKRSTKNKEVENPYIELVLDIVEQKEKISYWQLENIFVVEFESEYKRFSRIEYFNIRKYAARFFKEYSSNILDKIKDYRLKLQIIDYILKDKNLTFCINDRLQAELRKEKKSGYNIYLTTNIREIIKLLKKGGLNVEDKIRKESNKLYVLYNLGIQIHEELKLKKLENKLESFEYKMLNSLKSGNKQEFLDAVIRLHMFVEKDISPIFLEIMQDGGLDFSSIGHSFISGLISNKYEK